MYHYCCISTDNHHSHVQHLMLICMPGCLDNISSISRLHFSLLVQCSSTVFFGACTQLLSFTQSSCRQRNALMPDTSRLAESNRHSCIYCASTFVRWLPCVIFFAGNLVHATAPSISKFCVRNCISHALEPADTHNQTHLRALRSRPYKLSSSSMFPLFSFFAQVAVFCRQEWTCFVLAPKRARLQWDGFLSLFAEQCYTHQMICNIRARVIYGRLHTLSA